MYHDLSDEYCFWFYCMHINFLWSLCISRGFFLCLSPRFLHRSSSCNIVWSLEAVLTVFIFCFLLCITYHFACVLLLALLCITYHYACVLTFCSGLSYIGVVLSFVLFRPALDGCNIGSLCPRQIVLFFKCMCVWLFLIDNCIINCLYFPSTTWRVFWCLWVFCGLWCLCSFCLFPRPTLWKHVWWLLWFRFSLYIAMLL